jgi:hypothetical protein
VVHACTPLCYKYTTSLPTIFKSDPPLSHTLLLCNTSIIIHTLLIYLWRKDSSVSLWCLSCDTAEANTFLGLLHQLHTGYVYVAECFILVTVTCHEIAIVGVFLLWYQLRVLVRPRRLIVYIYCTLKPFM